ncbi:hypothetical protein Tcan_07736 [Toxocara canis]|uniref:G_PROTEIN_RECEP_F1_2 domain-containing protein n=1 Tax=Toxocara canis TaxID=6265 RepID=A0A0B2UVN9_TOXCA|nr:hypothetical protein Tcan_07736 [Toxocara canis]
MLSTIWLLLCIVIGCVQLLVATQLEWLVNGDFVQGLWAICKLPECHIRESLLSLSVLVMYLLGAVLLLLSAIVSLPIVWSKKVVARFNDAKRLGLVANVQFIAALSMGIAVCLVPFDMFEVQCTLSMLLQSSKCRVGWAYACACIVSLLSVCCPVLARLISDQHKRYTLLITEHFL